MSHVAEQELNWCGVAKLPSMFCLHYRAANLPKAFDLVLMTKLTVGDIGKAPRKQNKLLSY